LELLSDFVNVNAHWIHELRLSSINPIPGMPFSTPNHLSEFVAELRTRVPAHIIVNQFTAVGRTVGMACGQMRALSQSVCNQYRTRHSVTVVSSGRG